MDASLTPLIDLVRAAFEEYWIQDNAQPIHRRQMHDAVRALDSTYSESNLDIIFNAMDKNQSGAIQYEDFIDFVFSNEQVVVLASRELDLLQLAVEGTVREKTSIVDEEAEIERILQESQSMAVEEARRKEEQLRMEDEKAIRLALEASAAEEAAEFARLKETKQKEEEAERLFLEASAKEAQAEAARRKRAQAAAEEEMMLAAVKASEDAAMEEKERIRQQHEEEDSSDLFRAALRASCLDLGPRGVSQAAKVFSTGDASIGQPRAGFDTSTAGARGRRNREAAGAAPAYTGTETAAGKAPVAGRSNSPVAQRRQAEWASRTSGFAATRQ